MSNVLTFVIALVSVAYCSAMDMSSSSTSSSSAESLPKKYKVRDIFKHPFSKVAPMNYEDYRHGGVISFTDKKGRKIVPCDIPVDRYLLQVPHSPKFISLEHVTTGRIGKRLTKKTRWNMTLSDNCRHPSGVKPFTLSQLDGYQGYGHPDHFGAYKRWTHYPYPRTPKPGYKRKYEYQATMVNKKYAQEFVAFCRENSRHPLKRVYLHALNSKYWLGPDKSGEFPLYYEKTKYPSMSFNFRKIENTVVLP